MASLPYPLNRLYTHIVSVIATTQSACILMSVWVWQGCHTLLQIPILLFFKNLFFCSSVFPQKHVLMFFCLFKQQHVLMFSCLSKKPVLLSFPNNMFSCSSVFSNNNMFSCPHVFKTKTCSHVLLSFQKQHVLLSFPQKSHILHPILSLCRQKKRLRATLPAVKP